jgi:MoxR-like ATPase
MSEQKTIVVACVSWTDEEEITTPVIYILPARYKSVDDAETEVMHYIMKKFFSELDIERLNAKCGYDELNASTEDRLNALLELAAERKIHVTYLTTII